MKNIEGYWIKKYDSGIYHILFNTKEKWVEAHRYNSIMYLLDEEEIEVEPFLDENERYLPMYFQEKDQTSWYYVPWKLLNGTKEQVKSGNRGKILVEKRF